MPPRERTNDRGRRRGARLIVEVGRDIRDARSAAALTQAQVGRACGISGSHEGKIERGEVRGVSIIALAQICEVVGLDLTVRTYPGATPLRDAAHLALQARFRARLDPRWTWRTEVPVPLPGDQRSWDAVIARNGLRIGVETETRLRDLQAFDRRIALKLRDSGLDRVVLVLADTRANRSILHAYGDAIRSNYPTPRPRPSRHWPTGATQVAAPSSWSDDRPAE